MGSMKGKTILITGASSGIGAACAEQYAALGADLILSARRADRIAQLADHLRQQFGIKVFSLVLDVRDREAVFAAIDELELSWRKIDVLVNNAGLALASDLFQDGSCDDWDVMIDTNIKGLLYMTRSVAPLMLEHGSGHIVNIGSIAGLECYVRGNVYCATKHAVHALNKSMRIDLLGKNIRVTEIDPGAVATEFSETRWKGDKQRADEFYEQIACLVADDIADAVVYATTRSANVNIEQMVVTHRDQASVNHVMMGGRSGGAFENE